MYCGFFHSHATEDPSHVKVDNKQKNSLCCCSATTCSSFLIFRVGVLSFLSSILLILSGDIEINPGPINGQRYIHEISQRHQKNKLFHTNTQSLHKKHLQLSRLVSDIGSNCIYGFSETWLTDSDPNNIYNPDQKNLECFRLDRSNQKTGGGVMLLVPKSFNPKHRPDLNMANTYAHCKMFESLWLELKSPKVRKKFLINIYYNPNRNHTEPFLEGMALSIDRAITENKTIIMMGDYNIDYFKKSDKNSLETIFQPYDLRPLITQQPTRCAKRNSLIDYILTDSSIKAIHSSVVDSAIKSDHFGQFAVLEECVKSKAKVLKKNIYDKKNYNILETLFAIDWCSLNHCQTREAKFQLFEKIAAIRSQTTCTPRPFSFIKNHSFL